MNITDEMVEAALKEWFGPAYDDFSDDHDRQEMRAALAAALALWEPYAVHQCGPITPEF